MTIKIYTITQAAEYLGISTKTVRRHLALGFFENCIIIQHGKRVETLFKSVSLTRYKKLHMKPAAVKRQYHRRMVKWQHASQIVSKKREQGD